MWNSFNSQASTEYRAMNRGNIIPYPVEFLNRSLTGIRPTDLIFIGARSGAGKTEFAAMLAQNVSKLGKQVYYFALEADRGEIESRLLYREFAKIYYTGKNYIPINYRDFSDGNYDGTLRDYIKQAGANCNKVMQNVNILYREDNFTVDSFEEQVGSVKEYADLILLDHVHHFDMNTDRETQELKKIVKRLRDINILIKKPIACIAHFRKSDRKTQELVPGFEDLYGSSEISKEATQVITLAPITHEGLCQALNATIDVKDMPLAHEAPTLFRIPKFRKLGSVTKYVALVMYNNRTNSYNTGFKLFRFKKNGMELEAVDTPDFMQEFRAEDFDNGSI